MWAADLRSPAKIRRLQILDAPIRPLGGATRMNCISHKLGFRCLQLMAYFGLGDCGLRDGIHPGICLHVLWISYLW
jgi:hypothetical protein